MGSVTVGVPVAEAAISEDVEYVLKWKKVGEVTVQSQDGFPAGQEGAPLPPADYPMVEEGSSFTVTNPTSASPTATRPTGRVTVPGTKDTITLGGSEWSIENLDNGETLYVKDSQSQKDIENGGLDRDTRRGHFEVVVEKFSVQGETREEVDVKIAEIKKGIRSFALTEAVAPAGFDGLKAPVRIDFNNTTTLQLADIVNTPMTEPPEPSTVTETTRITVTETPTPVTKNVTTTATPPTVTTTVTPPATTVTATPKTETTTATTTESATTTVTETPQTETVTETPQRETVTHTPEKETETVTHTPDKETVTETPKASTETKISTVTAPQVTVTETPKQVTETTTLPQKTVTEQVPTTVVENKTETVKLPPVTVTETEKQEPVTVTETPEKVTETVEVPGEKTTMVETKPGEPTTVRETVTETPGQPAPDVPSVVEQPTPNAPVVDTSDTPVILGAFSGTVVWDKNRSKTVNGGDERISGLTVVALKDGKEISRTTTDENGFYKFNKLEPSEYGIVVYGPDGGELFFEDKAATVVAGEEDTGNDWGFVREDAPAPAQSGVVRKVLASTGVSGFALTGLGALVAALGALFVVRRKK